MRIGWLLAVCVFLVGCGTTKWTDTRRTATEQMLISDAMDRAVSRVDFRALAGKRAYLNSDAAQEAVDHQYLTSTIRQHMLASGCLIADDPKDADYVVELRAGAVGTDRHHVLYGMPSMTIPAVVPMVGTPMTIPEIPLAKKTDQQAVVKIAVFAYNRTTGRPLWQSGVVPAESQAKDLWFLGAGPFQRGTIYDGTDFAGERFDLPLVTFEEKPSAPPETISVADEAFFRESVDELADVTFEPLGTLGIRD